MKEPPLINEDIKPPKNIQKKLSELWMFYKGAQKMIFQRDRRQAAM